MKKDNWEIIMPESTYMRQKREKKIARRFKIFWIIMYTLFASLLLLNYILLYKVFARVNLFIPQSELKKQLLTMNQARHKTGSYCVNCYNK